MCTVCMYVCMSYNKEKWWLTQSVIALSELKKHPLYIVLAVIILIVLFGCYVDMQVYLYMRHGGRDLYKWWGFWLSG